MAENNKSLHSPEKQFKKMEDITHNLRSDSHGDVRMQEARDCVVPTEGRAQPTGSGSHSGYQNYVGPKHGHEFATAAPDQLQHKVLGEASCAKEEDGEVKVEDTMRTEKARYFAPPILAAPFCGRCH